MVAPDDLPEHLTWFKWESYATWLSGFALLVVVYYASPELYLLDPEIIELEPEIAIVISLALDRRRLAGLRPGLPAVRSAGTTGC